MNVAIISFYTPGKNSNNHDDRIKRTNETPGWAQRAYWGRHMLQNPAVALKKGPWVGVTFLVPLNVQFIVISHVASVCKHERNVHRDTWGAWPVRTRVSSLRRRMTHHSTWKHTNAWGHQILSCHSWLQFTALFTIFLNWVSNYIFVFETSISPGVNWSGRGEPTEFWTGRYDTDKSIASILVRYILNHLTM